jgi:hypothetical protein
MGTISSAREALSLLPVPDDQSAVTGWRKLLDRHFYFLMSLLIGLITLYGFSRTVGDKLVHPLIPRPFALYLHAALFSVWVAFFIAQSALVTTGNVRWHRITGWFGAVIGLGVLVVGVWTALTMARFNVLHFHSRHADLALLISFYDISAFAIPFALAIYWRRKPELHRRLMLISMCALMAAAFGRFPIPPHVRPVVFFYIAVDFLLLIGIARDLVVTKRMHPAYICALAAFIVCQLAVGHTIYHHSKYWSRMAQVILN